jgi:Flp pilus assembly pilin Flp
VGVKRFLLRFQADAAGVDLVEYAMLAGVVTLAAAAGLGATGESIRELLDALAGFMELPAP